jgi:enamine deaminase RidA (YjgF/YER057c/UK114 family)
MNAIDARLRELAIDLPPPPAAAAAYRPVVLHAGLAYVSGQLPRDGALLIRGQVGDEIDVATGKAAARACALAVLSVLRQALGGDLGRVRACLQLSGFVAAVPGFEAHSEVINGASDLLVEVLGPAGGHARAAVGVATLPFGVPVEVSAVFAVREPLQT